MMINLLEQERIDDLHINGYQIIQNNEDFCFGIDAVLLSDFVKAKKGAKVIDLGTGTGIIPILLSAKTKAEHIYGLEIQEKSVNMARRSVQLNHLEDKIEILAGDIKEAATLMGAASFDVVVSNPPYMIASHGLNSAKESKNIARHEVLCCLEDVVSQGSKLLKEGGTFFMVHKPFRLAEIIDCMIKYHLEPKRLRMVHSYVNKEPSMVLIEGRKGSASYLHIEPPLIVYSEPGQYSDEIYQIYGYEKEGMK
ncbi:MAG: tRNA1(Val) (adenine(37)-N6)-methyltransferase [Lachnospiraceae bacterium]|nr:tRNA1(Val) (adenine(37)-N6)-methyltransferase [Lachnospiraceae bacterium]